MQCSDCWRLVFTGYPLTAGFPMAAYGRGGFPVHSYYYPGMELLQLASWYPEAHLGF